MKWLFCVPDCMYKKGVVRSYVTSREHRHVAKYDSWLRDIYDRHLTELNMASRFY